MKQVFKIDGDGIYIEPVIVEDDAVMVDGLIDTHIPDGFYKPKWDKFNKKWIEGKNQEEIDTIKNAPVPKTEIEILKEELAASKEETAQMNLAIIELWEMLI